MKAAILTISDRSSQGLREDLSGPALINKAETFGWEISAYEIIPDEQKTIEEELIKICDTLKPDVLLTTGGTGFAPRDVTPEATEAVIQKKTPGISEYIRLKSLEITPHAMLSRATSGIRGKTLIINFPGSPKAAVESLEFVFPVLSHAVELINNDPNSEENH